MDRTELTEAVWAHRGLAGASQESGIAVWTALAKAEPELAAEILQLFSTVEAAARWATNSDDPAGSPAQQVAEGRAPDVLAKVRRAIHGFVA